MKKRMVAIIAGVLMLMTMIPAMAFAEDAAGGSEGTSEPREVSIQIGTDDMVEMGMALKDSTSTEDNQIFSTVTVTPEEPLLLVGKVGTQIKEAKYQTPEGEVTEFLFNGLDSFSSEEDRSFLGWRVRLAGGEEPEDFIDGLLSQEELMEFVISDEIPADRYLMITAQWEEYAEGDEGDEGDWSGAPIFAVSSNGGKLTIKDDMEGKTKTVDQFFSEFMSPEAVMYAVPFKIAGAEKAGAVLSGWTVYEADRIEIDTIPTSVADENGGLPPWGDPDLKHFIFDKFVENGVEQTTFIGLWNNKIVATDMSTEDLYYLGGNDKSYYAVANWTTGTVLNVTVNGQEAKLEIADDVTTVSNAILSADNGINTVADLKAALIKEVFASNASFNREETEIAFMEIVLKIKNEDGIWEIVTPDNFPKEGLEVVIPYPEKADKDGFMFTVLHMFSHGSKAGKIETLQPELKADGLHVTVYSLSPFAVAYQPVTDVKGDSSPATGDDFNLLVPAAVLLASAAVGIAALRRREEA